MLTLRLHPLSDQTTLDLLRAADSKRELRIAPDSCFWLGAVSLNDETAISRFRNAVARADIQEISGFASIASDVAYAVLVRDAVSNDGYHLFVFEMRHDYLASPKIAFAKKLPAEYLIDPKPPTRLPHELTPNPRDELRNAVLSALIPGPIKRFFSRSRSTPNKPRGGN